MSLLYMDGFSHYSTLRDVRQYLNAEGPVNGISSTGDGPYGENYLQGPLTGGTNVYLFWGDRGTPVRTQIYLQFHGRCLTDTADVQCFGLSDGQGLLDHLFFYRIHATNDLQVRRGAATTLLTSTSGLFTEDTWHYFEIRVVIDDTNGEVEVQIDGNPVFNSTGLDTSQGGAPQLTHIHLNGTGDADRRFDIANLIVMSTAGTRLNGFIGERRIVSILPNGGTTDSDWIRSSTSSTNWQLVDEVPISDTDYVYTESTGQTDRYELSNLNVAPNSIDAIAIKPTFYLGDWGPSHTPTCFVQVSTSIDESGVFYPADTHMIEQHIVEDNPASTGTGWSLAAIQNLTVGVKT